MITRLDLRHFKCFETLKLPLQPLTLLTGINASGKSSIMQAFVLLHQTMREHEWSSRLMLNGNIIELGSVSEVVDQVQGRRTCEIGLLDGEIDRFHWEFEDDRDAMSMNVAKIETNRGPQTDDARPLRHLLPPALHDHPLPERLRGLTYLEAERMGPRELYMFDDPQLTPVVGAQGEYAVSVLYSGRDERVLDSLVISGVPPVRFRQVEARMARFFPGCVLDVHPVPRANAVTLGIRTSSGTDFLRPSHTGFGLTQVLPIVVAALSAGQGDLLLIENPEVHLHPAGQAEIGRFLAETAAAGVQVLIETHSDHVLNGIRRAVKEHLLPAHDVALHFFRPRSEGTLNDEPQVVSPHLDALGGIDDWPEGFFDQFDKDMTYFADWT